jgi:hypothetical protein
VRHSDSLIPPPANGTFRFGLFVAKGYNGDMTAPKSNLRWFYPKPYWLILGLLVVECLLWLSERFQWFGFNHHKGWTVLIAVAAVGMVFVAMLFLLAASLLFRWRFQFSIRSLLTLTVAIAIPCSWFAVEMKKAREQMAAVEALIMLDCGFQYDYEVQFDPSSGVRIEEEDRVFGNGPNVMPSGSAWLRKYLGDDFFNNVYVVEGSGVRIADADLAHFEVLKSVVELRMTNNKTTDAGLVHLAGLTQLQLLELNGTQITDAGLARIAGLTQLQVLYLDNTQVTDEGMAHIAGLTQLQKLSLDYTQITDSGLAHLAGLTQLQELWLNNAQVTDAGVKKLQQALPNCEIQR